MTDLILHHYDLSPFGEKVRLALGHKGLAWASVEIPIWPPRPQTVPLTAGYRRAPVLQIGADIWCDTLSILAELERRFPEPTLYPEGQTGLASILSWWADTTTFLPAARLATSVIGDGVPSEFITDRIAFMGEDFTKGASIRDLGLNRQRVAAQMSNLADMLTDGRAFLLGENLSAADLSAYHTLWFLRTHAGSQADAMVFFPGEVRRWMERVSAVGHGQRSAMAPEDALRIARASEPAATTGVCDDDPCGLPAGTPVLVQAEDANDPIRGVLVAANPREIVISHETPEAGLVHVHFPRFGYNAVADAAGSSTVKAA